MERRGGQYGARARMTRVALLEDDDFLVVEPDAEILERLGPDAREKGRDAIVVRLADRFERMMMAFGALHAHPEENLTDAFGAIVGRVEDSVEVGRAVRHGRAPRGDQFADKNIEALIVPERRLEPVVQGPHFLLAVVAPVAQEVRPLQAPPGSIRIVMRVLVGIAG
jgi:hypothetical protein